MYGLVDVFAHLAYVLLYLFICGLIDAFLDALGYFLIDVLRRILILEKADKLFSKILEDF